MYVREIKPPRSTPLENGEPLYGTWTQIFDTVDLLDIRKPYRIPLLPLLADSRLKEWESFVIQDDRFSLLAVLCNIKYCRFVSVVLYDRENKERLWFKKTLPGGGWRLPRSLKNASVVSRSWNFFIRIHPWLDADTIQLDLDIEPTRKRPSFTAHAALNLAGTGATPMAVSLPFSEQRNMYACKIIAPVKGDLVFGGRHITLDPSKTTGLFCDFKGFFPRPMHTQWCTAVGFDSSNRRIGFTVAENQAKESFANNENALWVDGKLTPLPPVKITHTTGTEREWVIQDMEGMVDLVFTPKEHIKYKLNVLLPQSWYECPLGFYNGVVVNSHGEEIPLRNMWGMGEKLNVRV